MRSNWENHGVRTRSRPRSAVIIAPRDKFSSCALSICPQTTDCSRDARFTSRTMPRCARPWRTANSPKSFIQRDQDTIFRSGLIENFFVSGIARPIPGPNHIMSGSSECGAYTAPYARVQQNLHAVASTNNGSTRSCPMTRRAYKRLARISSGSSQG
jgi:hypothetical protein